MKSWNDIGFEIEITGDSSPSLRLLASVDPTKFRGESMHHSGGACAETLLIYGKPIHETLQTLDKPHFLVVGLGLGYIELVIARESLLLGKSADQIGLITSYESVSELREFFFRWLWDQSSVLSKEVWDTYESVAGHVLSGTTLSVADLKRVLRPHFAKLEDIQGALSAEAPMLSRYHCILYDAFSSKTSPFLWEEEFLVQLLREGAARKCQVSTYACKASLKRALKRLDFEVIVREGFQGKRNSTLGVRG